jgi:acetyl-CoA acetyltransferase
MSRWQSRVVIVGIGETTFTPAADGVSGELLTVEAIEAAAVDAGISAPEIDGIVKYSYDGTMSDSDLARVMGMKDVTFSAEIPHGGGSCCSLIRTAGAAIQSGLARTVVCYRTVVGRQWIQQMAAPDRTRPYYADAKWYLRPAGSRSYLDVFALLFSEHQSRYGTRKEHLGALAVAARRQARNHANAVLTVPLSMEEYLSEALLAGALSASDDYAEADGSVAVIITSEERAAHLPGATVDILATAEAGGAYVHGYWELAPLREDPLSSSASRVAERLYAQSGLSPDDVDVALLYDCTTVAELQLLEECRLIPRGEPDVVLEADFGIRRVPVNPHGGHLAGGYLHGFSQVAEAARQVRGTASNQVPGAQVALVVGPPMGTSSGAILVPGQR